jgi:hypothetical protein
MNPVERFSFPVRRMFLAVVLLAVCWPSGAFAQPQDAQAPEKTAPAQSQPPAGQQPPQASSSSSPSDKASSPDKNKPSDDNDEVKITPQQAEELFHSVDEILEFDSKQTGLPIKHEVKRKLTSRDEVVSYLTKHVDDEDTQRLRRSELVLKKFGLLPRDFNLETFLVALLREEVAGYYDPKTKTVNLLDWVPMEEQEPVMAHELTHALQDQSFGLNKWMQKGDKDLTKIRRDLTPSDIENDESDDAREAVVEGQAQAMMFQYALAPTGHSIVDSPDLVDAMENETTTGTSTTKVFNEAPIFLQESLTFPYSYGMEFVIKLMRKGGKDEAFTAVLKNPPHTTRQIMEPATYLSGEKIEPIGIPDFKRDFKDYQKFDIGAMGEFDVAILAEQYAGKTMSKHIYPEWRGGYYYAATSRQAPAAGASVTASLGLLYVSRWSSAEAASEFAGIYAHSLKERYKQADEVGGSAADQATEVKSPQISEGTQTSESQNSEKDSNKKSPDEKSSDAKIHLLTGRHVWNTEEGPVVIEQQGNTVLVSESLDSATTQTVEKEVFAK